MTEIIAHRGASRAARENTIDAFRLAGTLGAGWIELDVRRCADDTLAVHHDARLADGRPIVGLVAADLPPHIPTLDAALTACRPLRVNIEIKNDESEPDFDESRSLAGAVVDLVRARGETADVLVSSFDRTMLDRVHERAPQIATAFLTSDVPGPPARHALFASLVADGHAGLHPWWGLVDADVVADAHEVGLFVNVWTVDDPEAMARLAGWGVDGICTNVPDVAADVLGRS